MEPIDYIDGLFTDVPRIPDYWIAARLNTEAKGHASIWYTEMKEMHDRRHWPWWKSQIIQKYRNDKESQTPDTNARGTRAFSKMQMKPKLNSRLHFKYLTRYHYANNCPKAKKKVYAIEKAPGEESPTEDFESDSMGDAIREQSDEEQGPREEFTAEYQEETPLEIQDIQLEEGMSQDTSNINLCKNTQDSQKFLGTPTKGMAYIYEKATKLTV
ncbi:hypothetical protein O181_085457 [Austropuccinia psidii MF-1]|uniref:Uncharacterized protein n=1 Tax=Austropuccinia psidii MF-1 TaxID=1389203 RepID=A0A9Q3ILQ1_9BASI|nr:hypothetical protein [Austropuccinia psidii MF-1]